MRENNLKSKFLGSLVGSALGDSLGAGWEGTGMIDSEQIDSLANRMVRLCYTDDTHMMIGIAESLIANRGFRGKHMAQTFIKNYESEPWRGYGPGPPRIFQMIKNGEAWNHASNIIYQGGSFGNGSAMRVAPVGLLYHYDSEKLRDFAYKSSSITHSHELGKEGAALQAYAVALAFNTATNEQIQQDAFLYKMQNFTNKQIYKEKLELMIDLLSEQDKGKVIAVLGNGIEATKSVLTATYCFLRQPKFYRDCILYAIGLGGDTDTIAAMTGAISGAHLGIEGIPSEWKEKIENREYIEALAGGLWQLATD